MFSWFVNGIGAIQKINGDRNPPNGIFLFVSELVANALLRVLF
jgi:hypothetical protein